MAVLSSFLWLFIVLGMYNFDFKRSSCKKIIHFNCYLFLNISFQCSSFQFFIILAKFMYWLYFLCQFAWKVNIAGEFFFCFVYSATIFSSWKSCLITRNLVESYLYTMVHLILMFFSQQFNVWFVTKNDIFLSLIAFKKVACNTALVFVT